MRHILSNKYSFGRLPQASFTVMGVLLRAFPQPSLLHRAIVVFFLCALPVCSFAQTPSAQGPAASSPQGHSKEFDDPGARESWFRRGRQGVQGKPAAELRLRALRKKAELRALRRANAQLSMAAAQATAPSSPQWTSLGPSPINLNIGGNFGDYGFVVGRVTSIAVDQTDPTANTVYVGGAFGGLWKSINAAATDPATVTWTPLLDDQPTLAVGAVTLKPDNTQVVLVGTGEPNNSPETYYGVGILRSADGGTTWNLIGSADNGSWSFRGTGFSRIVFSADNTNLAVAGAAQTNGDQLGASQSMTRPGLYYTLDAGFTWHLATMTDAGQPIAPASATDVVYNRVEHKFFAALRFHGIYSSTDGINWSRLANQPTGSAMAEGMCPPARAASCPMYRATMTMRPGADEMYVWFNNGSTDQGIYQTTDGGGSWTQILGPSYSSCNIDTSGCLDGLQLPYNLTIAAVPTALGTDLYIGHVNLFKCSLSPSNPTCQNNISTTGNWLDLTHVYGCTPFGAPAHVHPDQHAIEFSFSSPDVMYFGNDGGVYRTLSASTGLISGSCTVANAFDNLDANFGSMAQFVSFSMHPTDSSTILGGTQDNGSPAIDATHGGTNGFTWQAVATGDGAYNEINPNQPTEWFTAETGVSVFRCPLGINCGQSDFQLVVSPPQVDFDESDFYTPYMLDPQNTANILIGTCRVWRGPSSGAGWTSANALSSNFDASVPSVCVSPLNNIVTALAAGGPSTTNGSQVIYAGTAVGNIFVTTNADGGPSTWAQGFLTNSKSYPVSSLAIDSHDPTGRTAYATVMGFGSGHVFKTADGGNQWMDITGDLPDAPADSVIVDPNDSNILYVGTDIGVFQTLNGGTNWVEYGPTTGPGSLPDVVVTRLRIFGKQKLRASTYGRGVWEINLNTFPDFQLAVGDPTSIVLFPSQTSSFQGTISAFNNYASSVAIACGPAGSPLPATCQGATVSPTTTPVPFAVGVSNPTVQDFSFSIIGTGSDPSATTHQQRVKLNVVDFGLTAPVPSSMTLARGAGSPPISLSVTASGSFRGTVSLACNGLPSGANCTFTPAAVSPLMGTPASVSLSISTSSVTPPGSFPITIQGTANSMLGPVTRSSPFNLTVTLNPQFVITTTPSTAHVRVGEPGATANITVSSQDGYTGTVQLSCSVAPVGPSCLLAQSSFSSLPSTTTLTINANNSPSGRYAVSLSGTDASTSHMIQLPFAISDFALSGPAPAAANTGNGLALPWTVIPQYGYTGNLALTCDATALGAQATCSVPATLDLSAGFVTGFTLRIAVPAAAPPGTYAVNVLASDGFLSHASQIQIAVVSSSSIQVTGITPQEEEDGGIPVFMTVFGRNFTPQSKVLIDGVDYGVTFPSSSTAIGVATPTQIFNQLGVHQFSVTDPQLGTSNSVPFRIFVPDQAALSMQAQSSINMPVFFGGAVDVAVGDFENIGLQDLAVLGGQVLLLHNTGGGSLIPAGQTPYQGGNAQFLLSGDLNGDGKLDLIVVNQSQQAGVDNNANFTVLLGDGQGHFTQSGNFSLPVNPFQGALLDLNGDGKLDLLLGTSGSGLILLPGKGDGTFGPATTIGPPANFVVGDVNGKGSKDIILNGPGQIRVLLNNGIGSFQEVDPPELQGLTGKVVAGDFNADGLLDLFVQGDNELPGRAQVFLGKGQGSFSALPEFQFAPPECSFTSPYSFAVADFDGDGKLDLAGGSGESNPSRIVYLWGKGDGTFKSQFVPGPRALQSRSGDVTGDGIPDLIAIGDSLSIIPGNRFRSFASPSVLFPNAGGGTIRTGDVNGDNLPDLMRGGEIFLNRGNGVFSPPIPIPSGMRLADLNGDGLADLIGCSGTNVQIWPGDGSGTFNSTAINVPIGTSCPSDVVVVDLDRDGHPDIVGTGFILYGKGGFSFDLVPIPGSADGPLLVGDFNGDGRLDLIETRAGYILFGQPNRTFQAIFNPAGVVPATDISSYAVADFNLDGKDDVAAASLDGSDPIFLLISQGDGTFSTKSILSPRFIGFGTDLVTGDFNGDGIPDLAAAIHINPAELVVFINDGHGGFSRAFFPSGVGVTDITADDFNGDGKTDLALGNQASLACPARILVMLAGGASSSRADFTLTRGTRATQTVKAGDAADAYDLIVTPSNTTPGHIALVCTGLPPGATCQFSPMVPVDTSLGPVLESVSVQTTAGVTPPGTYSFLVQGKLLNATKPADGPFTLTVTSTQPHLTIKIAPPSSPPAVGNPHSYHLTINNSGATAATGVQMQMTFSLSGTVSTATPQQGTCALGPPVQCSLGSIAVGQTVAIDVTAVFMPDGVSPVSNPILNVTGKVTENEQDAVIVDNTATLVETVGDFQVTASPASATVIAGQSGSYSVTVAPRQLAPTWGPFAAPVALACSGLPSQSTCNFSPSSVTPGANSVSVTLTIATTARTSATLFLRAPQDISFFSIVALAFAASFVLAFLPKAHRKPVVTLVFLVFLIQLAIALGACNGGGSSGPPPPPVQGGTPAGTYTITVTGTSGIAQRTTQIKLVVQ